MLRAYVAPAMRAAAERPRFGKLFAQLQFSANPEIREMGRDAMEALTEELVVFCAAGLRAGAAGAGGGRMHGTVEILERG